MLAKRYRLLSSKRRGLLSIEPLPLPYKILEPITAIVKAENKAADLLYYKALQLKQIYRDTSHKSGY